MFKRTTCAAAVAAAFSLAATPAVQAQSGQPATRTVQQMTSPATHHHMATPNRGKRLVTPVMPEAHQAPRHSAVTLVTPAAMPAAIDELTSDVVVLPTYHAHQNLSQLTPFEPLGSIQTRSQGTPGSFGGLSIRGHALEDTLVLIDGFRVSPASGADFSLLPMAYGSRTEILRGAGSGLYGQNANGGVVQFLSDAAGPKTHASGEAGIGGRGYMQMRGRLSGGNAQITGSIDVGRERGDGFDVTAKDAPGHQNDQDGWKRDNLSGRLDARLSTATHVTVVAMRNTVNADFDGDNAGNTALAAKKRLELTGVRAEHELMPGTQVQAKFGQSSISNTYNYSNDTARWDKTRLREYGLGADHQITREVRAHIGIERLEESYDTSNLSSPTRTTDALHGSAVGNYGPHQLNLAMRLDDSNRFKKTFSHQIGYGYRLADNLRVVGNISTGYRAPALSDYYASPENNRLKQQRTQTIDAGAYWQPDQITYAKAIVHRSRIHDRITASGDCTGVANCSIFNVGRATVSGLALSVGQDTAPGQAFEGLRWQANLDLIRPKNNSTGLALPHVAKRSLNGQVDYGLGEYSVGADVVLNNRHFSDEANQQRVGGTLLINLRSAWRVSNELTAYADVYNLGNRHNTTWHYYNQQARTVMLGVSYSPRY